MGYLEVDQKMIPDRKRRIRSNALANNALITCSSQDIESPLCTTQQRVVAARSAIHVALHLVSSSSDSKDNSFLRADNDTENPPMSIKSSTFKTMKRRKAVKTSSVQVLSSTFLGIVGILLYFCPDLLYSTFHYLPNTTDMLDDGLDPLTRLILRGAATSMVLMPLIQVYLPFAPSSRQTKDLNISFLGFQMATLYGMALLLFHHAVTKSNKTSYKVAYYTIAAFFAFMGAGVALRWDQCKAIKQKKMSKKMMKKKITPSHGEEPIIETTAIITCIWLLPLAVYSIFYPQRLMGSNNMFSLTIEDSLDNDWHTLIFRCFGLNLLVTFFKMMELMDGTSGQAISWMHWIMLALNIPVYISGAMDTTGYLISTPWVILSVGQIFLCGWIYYFHLRSSITHNKK